MKTLCQPNENGICEQCKESVPLRMHRTCSAKNRGEAGRAQAKRSVGLGDQTATFFESLGITKERYIAAKSALGFQASCGCESRKQWLNRLGESLGINDAASRLAELSSG